jgi:hypothetical protein
MADAQSDRLCSARSAELAENRGDVEFDSMLGNREVRRNLFIPSSAREHLQDFAFSGCQRFRKLVGWARRRPSRGKHRIYPGTIHDDKPCRCGPHSCNELLGRRPRWQDRPDARSHRFSNQSGRGMVCEEDNHRFRRELQLDDGPENRFELLAGCIYQENICFSFRKVVGEQVNARDSADHFHTLNGKNILQASARQPRSCNDEHMYHAAMPLPERVSPPS